MAFDLGEAILKLRTDTDELIAGLTKGEDAATDYESKTKETAQKSSSNWQLSFLAIKAAAELVIGAFQKISGYAGQVLDAWMQQEDASKKLEASLKATGTSALVSQGRIEQLASSLQKVTSFGDEATTSAAAMLQQLGKLSEEGLVKIIPLVQDFSAAMGIDLERAAMMVGKTIGTSTNAMTRYGVEIDATATKQEKLDAISKALTEKFGGMAVAMADTTRGGLTQFKNAIGDLMEIGGELLSKVILPIVKPLTEWAAALGDLINKQQALNQAINNEKIKDLPLAISAAEEKLSNLTKAYKEYINTVKDNNPWTKKIIADKEAEIDATVKLIGALKTQQYNTDYVIEQKKKEAEAKEKSNETALTSFELLQMQEDATRGLTVAQVAGTAAAREATVSLSDQVDQAGEVPQVYWNIMASMDELAAKRKKEAADEKARQDTIAKFTINASRDIFSSIGKDLAMGELSWKSLGTAAVRSIGRIVSALGDMLAADAAADFIKALAASASILMSWAAPGLFSSAAIKAGGAAAAWVTGAALQAVTLKEGGEFVVPPGYPNDSFPMLVESGEKVKVTPADKMDDGQMQVTLMLDGNVLGKWLERASKNQEVIIHAGAIV
jgi:hypothetical protein